MTSDEIRSTFRDFFVARDHKRLPSGSLVPATYDPSVLLTTAGMHPLKPYFLGQEKPPHNRLTTCQKCFRSTDIENVGNTARHLTFFEMLGNFSIGDYFKQGAVELAWELSLEGFGFDPDRIWITVHGGDEALGLGPDEEAIEAWKSVGVPEERIVRLGTEDNFWQAGPTGPCGPCSELYFDRGPEFGSDDDRPGDDTERILEYWNLVFMQYDQDPPGTLTAAAQPEHRHGPGPQPHGGDPAGRPLRLRDGPVPPADRAGGGAVGPEDGGVPRGHPRPADPRRPLARHDLPHRRRRRALQRGPRLHPAPGHAARHPAGPRARHSSPGFMPRFADRVTEIMGGEYPELVEQREAVQRWVAGEEEAFGRTLEKGLKLLGELIERAKEEGLEGIGAEAAFQLHDTFGFPFDLTREIAAEAGLGVDETGFETLMERQRARARSAAEIDESGDGRERVREFAGQAGFETRFTGYETVEQHTTVGAVERENGRMLAKLVESPFYAAGGGQISDAGIVECEHGDCRARVAEVYRLGDDQAVALEVEDGTLKEGERVVARVDLRSRHATEANHTATHLLHAALRERLGTHVRQAGSYVGPDKLRFDFTHGGALTADELRDVEDRVNEWILADHPVRALTTTIDEAKRLGAMALFGEKYGDVVRMVEVGDGSFSRELCGGTHVHRTAEIGLFKVTTETSSAANVRRIEALTGPVGVELMRSRDAALERLAKDLRTRPEQVEEAVARLRETAKADAAAAPKPEVSVDEVLARADEVDGARLLVADVQAADEKQLLELLDRVKPKLGDAAIVLGAPGDGRVMFVASVAPALVERGVKAGAIVKAAAEVAGGGGGGRDTMARAGGRDPDKLGDALDAARAAIADALS